MFEFLFNSLIYILAIYGLLTIIKEIINIYTCTNLQSDGTYFIIATKNQENKIEGFMRSLLFRIIYGKEDVIKNILIADLNSKDCTKQILEKLETEYDCIKVVNWNECKEIMESVNES